MAFDISSISKTKRLRAPKIVIAGPGKIGKTTFAAQAPNAIGILTEDGADNVDTNAFPLCNSLQDVYAAISTLISEKHKFESVFLDSLDWLEPLLHQHVCDKNKWANIEAAGYGKGYIAAADEWRVLLSGLEALRTERNMAVILIAHDKIKRFESPLSEGYDQYVLKLHDRAGSLVSEWADVIGWASSRIVVSQADAGYGNKETKAKTTGERILHVENHPAHMGGNRFSLKNMPLNWDAFCHSSFNKNLRNIFMAQFNFNAASVEPMAPRSFEPLPAGVYEMMVVKSDVKGTQAGTGHYIELEMHCLSGEYSGRRIWERLNVDNTSKQAQDIAQAALAALCKAIGIDDMTETEQLHDLPFLASIEIDRKDSTKNRIVGYSPVGTAPAKAPAPVARPAPAATAKKPWG